MNIISDKQPHTLLGNGLLPVEVVFHPSWWFKNAGITFDRDFFYHPAKRVESEKKMEQILYERFGKYGLGGDCDKDIPVIGAVHNASGYIVSAMLGCKLEFHEDAPPEVIPANMEELTVEPERAFQSAEFRSFEKLCESLKTKYGYLAGDVGWGGVLNTALDMRGQMIFLDMLDNPDAVKDYFQKIAEVTERFAKGVENLTGSSSIAVNRTVRHFSNPVFLHSECSVTMISEEQYEDFIKPVDIRWSLTSRPFGIHFCGKDPHRFASKFASLPHLDFLDVGWGGNVRKLREYLPETFLNIRLSPSEIVNQTSDEIKAVITRMVKDSGNPFLTGVCCINMDDKIADSQIEDIFETVFELRKQYSTSNTFKQGTRKG